MSTIERTIAQETLGITPVQFEADEEISLTTTDLYQLTLYGEADGRVRDDQERSLRILAEIAKEDGSPNVSTLQTLFEVAYSYGFSLDKHGYDGRVTQAIEQTAEEVVKSSFTDRWFLSEMGRICLPEITVSVNNEGDKDSRDVGLTTYVQGFSAGVVGRSIGREGLCPIRSGKVPLDFSIERSNLMALADNLFNSLQRDPDPFLSSLAAAYENATTIDELTNVRSVLAQVLPSFLTERVARVRDGKRNTKTQVGSRIVSFWSAEYEDPNIEYADALIKDALVNFWSREYQNPPVDALVKDIMSDPKLNAQRYRVAGEIGELRLTNDLLTRDLESGNIPQDVKNLMSVFLISSGETIVGLQGDELYRRYCAFLREQFMYNRNGEDVERFMEQTPYWQVSGRRQTVTPDTLRLSKEQYDQIEEINEAYLRYFGSVISLYNSAVSQYGNNSGAKLLVDKLEGGLPADLIPLCRKLMRQAGAVDSLRFDLIPDKNGRFWVGEAQIISGGTPPAVLYRQAFERFTERGSLIGSGILQTFVEKVILAANGRQPLTAILYSERPYSSDVSKTTSWAGNLAFINALKAEEVEAKYCFAEDLVRRADGQLYFVDGSYPNTPITTVYNRVDYVSSKAGDTLRSDAMQSVLNTVAEQKVSIFPSPYPILFGKGVYALVWDAEFEALLRQSIGDEQLELLRSCTPPTYWIDNQTVRQGADPKDWIRKGSYSHATLGLIMGADDPMQLLSTIQRDASVPYSAVMQRYVDSARPLFRILKAFRSAAGTTYKLWVPESYRLRVEPTSIDGNVCEVFVTGNKDRIVHGRETSIMTVASKG